MEYLFQLEVSEDTDREGDPFSLGKIEETSGYCSPSNVPVHEMFDSHTVWQILKPQSIHVTSESSEGILCINTFGNWMFKYNEEHSTAFMNCLNVYILYVRSDWLERSAWFICLKILLIQYNGPDSSKYRSLTATCLINHDSPDRGTCYWLLESMKVEF